jgi:hypothetical protein
MSPFSLDTLKTFISLNLLQILYYMPSECYSNLLIVKFYLTSASHFQHDILRSNLWLCTSFMSLSVLPLIHYLSISSVPVGPSTQHPNSICYYIHWAGLGMKVFCKYEICGHFTFFLAVFHYSQVQGTDTPGKILL